MSQFCDELKIDTFEVANGIGLDDRIGQKNLMPGPGWGGSCFPKDIEALTKMADKINVNLNLLKNCFFSNEKQKEYIVSRLGKLLNNDFKNKTIAILGLAFKAKTDDIRKSPAIDIIKKLKFLGANINAYDPQAIENMKNEIPDINYFDNVIDTLKKTDAILVLTEWDEFKNLDFELIKKIANKKIILDARNIINHENAIKAGFIYDSIGRGFLKNVE